MKQLWLTLCAAMLLLAACTAPGQSEQAPPPTPAPFSAGAAQRAGAAPQPGPVQNAQGLTLALQSCTAFGEGEAGAALKTVLAAAQLLNWAEGAAKESSIDSIEAHLQTWLAGQDTAVQNLFWANWPAVDVQAYALVRDLPGQLPLLADAGSPQAYDHYTPACYERLHCAVDRFLDAD